MSATVLVSGKLFRDPQSKTSGSGKVYCTATIKVGQGDDAQWWRLVTFSDSAIEELLALRDGDGIAASGSFKAEVYEAREGMRVSLSILADRVISAKRQKRERDKERLAEQRQGPIDSVGAQRPFDDEVPL